jgi:hypothetical protein
VADCVYPECPYPSASNRARCYFHDKKVRGLFDSTTQTARHTVRDSAVLDDEQREIADLLEVLGAGAGEIKAAIARSRPRHQTHGSRRRQTAPQGCNQN